MGLVSFNKIAKQNPKNNATSRVYPYGVAFNTITQSNLIH
jgi:hypothetical protein